jgi:peroxiredoxin Q/BCP
MSAEERLGEDAFLVITTTWFVTACLPFIACRSLRWRSAAAPPGGVVTDRLEPGAVAPAFTLPDDAGRSTSLRDFRGQRVVLYVYPAAMTPGCTKQACDFRDNLNNITAHGFAVIGLSPDPPAKLAKFRAKEGLTFPLLSDPDKGVLTAFGAYGEKQLYGKTVVGVIRSTFVIDATGVIESAAYAVKATGHVARLLRDLGVSN